MNMRQFLEKKVIVDPERVLLHFQDQEISYTHFNSKINGVAQGLLDIGMKKGDRVGLMLANCAEFLYCWFRCSKIGAVMVPINTAFKAEETKYILSHSEAGTLIMDYSLWEVVKDIRRERQR